MKYRYSSPIPNTTHTAVTVAAPIRNEILEFVSFIDEPVVTGCTSVTEPLLNRIYIVRKGQIENHLV